MKRLPLALLIAALSHPGAWANDPARASAPAGGWAAQAGGTHGGKAATPDHVYTVANRAELLAAIARSGSTAKIIKVAGVIDMSEGRPFASSAEQRQRSAVELPSNTTIIGIAPNAGFINASLILNDVKQVIIRNLHFRNPCDVNPKWDPKDGPAGNWNSLFDSVVLNGVEHAWIDHNSFTDAPNTDDKAPVENGRVKQCHDGALDIAKGSDFVTVSYNHFAEHEKNTLIGAGDRAVGDEGKLRVTLAHNLFENVHERAPRVRFGQVHVYNNYYVGDRKRKIYAHSYSIGAGKNARIISHNNAFDIAGATLCSDVARTPASTSPTGAFVDSGSLLNGAPLAGCELPSNVGWTVPYVFTPLAAADVKATVLAQAGAGKLAPGTLTVASEPKVPPGAADYFVEARVKAQANAGQVYVVARYIDPDNWYGAGLDVAGSKGKLKYDVVRMHKGVLTRLKQVTRIGTAPDRFHTVRLVFAGPVFTMYANGERITTGIDSSITARGQAGTYRTDDSTEIVSVKSGSAADKPARIALAQSGPIIRAQAGDAPVTVAVSAIGSDDKPLRFTGASSDPAIATVKVSGSKIIVTPKKPGKAMFTLTSASDTSVDALVKMEVAAPFVVPPRAVALGGSVQPAPGATVPNDTLLSIDFDSAPTLGSGAVRIYRQSDNALADTIPVGEDYDVIGYKGQDVRRAVRRYPVSVKGKRLVIQPHSARLAYNTAYFVEVSDGTVQGTLNGKPFAGIGKASRWSFRTSAARPAGTSITVDDDGPADFRTVQGALNHVMQYVPKEIPATISIRNGAYDELLYLRGKNNLTIRGESRNGVVLHGLNNDAQNPGTGLGQASGSPSATGGRSLFLIEAADLVTVESLTMRNDTLRSQAASGQAETLLFNEEAGRLVVKNASFFSEQDTIQVKGYSWFYDTLIAGNVDFIWGANRVALFENSELRTVGESANSASGGYLVQARTLGADDKGFVFLRSRFTHGPGPAGNGVPVGSTYLARSPGTPNTWDHVSFIDCVMDVHIAPVGWAGKGVHREPAPNPAVPNAARGWREYGTRDMAGKPVDLSKRVGGYQMTAAEVAAQFGSRALIFSGFGDGRGWNPQP